MSPPLCKDCKHILVEDDILTGRPDYLRAQCGHPKAPRSLVDGWPFEMCEDMRRHGSGGCAAPGHWWEQRA